MTENEEKSSDEQNEECEWCGCTGDIKRNNKYYWGTVIIIVIFFVILYILAG